MAAPLTSDDLRSLIAPPRPPQPRLPKGGIVFLLKTGIQLKTGIRWEDLPQEMGCGSGMTCWRRLRDWQRAGVFDRLQQVILR